MQTTQLYIDGVFVDAAARTVRRAVDDGLWPQMAAFERTATLRRIAKGITDRMGEIAAAETLDNGKPILKAEWDVCDAVFAFDYYADLTETHAARRATPVDLGDDAFTSTISAEPLGVVGAITPWNSPLLMAVWKVAPALASRCKFVLKPSVFCLLSCAILAEVIHAAGLPAGVFNLVTGTGPDAGAPLTDHPLVDKSAFTRSVVTGSKVMTVSAAGIRAVSLELAANPRSSFLSIVTSKKP